jgi:hypothetical protein
MPVGRGLSPIGNCGGGGWFPLPFNHSASYDNEALAAPVDPSYIENCGSTCGSLLLSTASKPPRHSLSNPSVQSMNTSTPLSPSFPQRGLQYHDVIHEHTHNTTATESVGNELDLHHPATYRSRRSFHATPKLHQQKYQYNPIWYQC